MTEDNVAFVTPTPQQLAQWLASTGWARVGVSGTTALYQSPAGEQLFVPEAAGIGDYAEAVERVIATVAEQAAMPVSVARLGVLTPDGVDLVAVRTDSPLPGVIALNDGTLMWTSSKTLALASASSAVAPRPSYGPLRPAGADAWVETVQARVLEGSFIVALSCPVAAPTRHPVMPTDVPYGRQVTRLMADAVAASVELAASPLERQPLEAWLELVEAGVSAELLDAVSGLVPRGSDNPPRELRVEYSPTLAAPTRSVELPPGLNEQLSAAAHELRGAGALVDATVEGTVVGLERRRRSGPRFTLAGTVTVAGLGERARRARVTVTAEIDERWPITSYSDQVLLRLTGRIQQHGRDWRMPEVSSVAFVEQRPRPAPELPDTFPGID